jgi:hypothetical protein
MRHNGSQRWTALLVFLFGTQWTGAWPLHRAVVGPRLGNSYSERTSSGCTLATYRYPVRYSTDFRLLLSPYEDPTGTNDARYVDDDRTRSTDTSSSSLLEQHVLASAQAQMDISRVLQSIYEDEAERKNHDLLFESERKGPPVSPRHVATAAAIVVGSTVFLSSHSVFITILTSVGVWGAALLDADSLSGALARIVGRSTLRSVQQSQPKLQAVARAVLTDDLEQWRVLECRVQELEAENRALRAWKARRLQVEAVLPRYSLAELKETAKFHGLPVGGSKMDLLWRLVEAKKIVLD